MNAFLQVLADNVIFPVAVNVVIAGCTWFTPNNIKLKYRILITVVAVGLIILLTINYLEKTGRLNDNNPSIPPSYTGIPPVDSTPNIATDETLFSDPYFSYIFTQKYGEKTRDEIALMNELSLENCGLYDIKDVALFTNLEYLNLNNNSIEDISPISKLYKLQDLRIKDNNIRDISPISYLTNLTRLSIGGNRIKDISSLYRLTKVTQLYIRENPIEDIEVLSNMTNLVWLTAYKCQIRNIDSLSSCHLLEHVSIYDNTRIEDISPLFNLGNLKEIKITNLSIPKWQKDKIRSLFPNAYIDL